MNFFMIQQRIPLLKPLILSQTMIKRAFYTTLFTFKPSTLIFPSTPYKIVKRFTHSGKFPKIISPKLTRVPPHNPSINQTPSTKTNITEILNRRENQHNLIRSHKKNMATLGKPNMLKDTIKRRQLKPTNHSGVENTITAHNPSNSTNDTTSLPSDYTSNTCRDLVPFVPSTSSPTPSPRNIVPHFPKIAPQPSSSSLANIALQRLLASTPPSTLPPPCTALVPSFSSGNSCTALTLYSPPSYVPKSDITKSDTNSSLNTSAVHDSSHTNKTGLPTLSEADIILYNNYAQSSIIWDNWDHTKLQLLSSLSPNADIGIYINNLKELQFITHDENPLESVKNHPGFVGKVDKALYDIYQQNKVFKYKSVEIPFSDLINQDNYSVGMLFANNDTVVLDGRHKHHNIFIDVPGGKLCPGYFTSHKEGVLISDKQPFGDPDKQPKKQYCTKINLRKPLWFIENGEHIIPLSPDNLKIWEDYISKDNNFNRMTNAIFESYSDECKNDAKKPYKKKEKSTIFEQEGTIFKPISRPPIITTDGDTDLYDPSSKLQINCRVYDPTGITGPELREISMDLEKEAEKQVNKLYTKAYQNMTNEDKIKILNVQREEYKKDKKTNWWWKYFEKLIKEKNEVPIIPPNSSTASTATNTSESTNANNFTKK